MFCINDPTTKDIIDFIASVSIISISIIALVLSILSLIIQRKHNKKSVRPAGYVQLNDSINGLFIKIINRGCGPMYIKSFKAESIDNKTEKNLYYHLPKFEINNLNFNFEYHTEPTGYWLAPGDTINLLELNGDHKDSKFMEYKNEIRKILGNITIKMNYTDVYDVECPLYTKKLDWYNRQL